MASSPDNLMMTVTEQHPWLLRPTPLTDSPNWIMPDMMFFSNETETLTRALPPTSAHSFIKPDENPLFYSSKPDNNNNNIPTVSGGSENEVPVRKQRRRPSLPPSGRVGKHKPRPSKRAKTTTFIVADPENFRQMVQQVTGLNFGDAALLQPQTQTQTSFVMDGSVSASAPVVANAAGRYLESSCSFPTLESWNV